MECDYKVIQIQKKFETGDKYDFPVIETRYIVVSLTTNKVIDDAQGYGYKTIQSAEKAMWYKYKGGKSKIDIAKKDAKLFWKSNSEIKDDLEDIMFVEMKEGNKLTNSELVLYVKNKYGKDIDPKWIKYMCK